uniref:NADH-ubiquinone oxidoreductase chain 4 n=1 Tax=Discolomatinae sp. GENSP01 TaxID=1205622 RepID=A0A0S2MNQ1_9CUCU|nr:NADH deshydrogenase subunit 4 [Discolomatinae sp. GENSP01]
MMKFIFMVLILIPLTFIYNFWLMVFFLVLVFFYFFIFNTNLFFTNLSFNLGFDLLSYILILLTLWISILMILASEKIYFKNKFFNFYNFMILMLMMALILTFSVMNMFMFYLFFEISLIPILFMILGWGYQPERIQAGMYLLFYTMFASLPLLMSLFILMKINNSLCFNLLNLDLNLIYYLMINMVFFIKIPMFLVHLWLPKAHVEAPVAGSMILAGVMLKLGGYGLLRFLVLFKSVSMKFNFLIINLSLFGSLVISLECLRQSDMKSLIAYSSVAHMGLMMSGLLTLNYWGMVGSLMMMIAHGVSSSALFVLVNINYERLYSRSIYLNKGLMNIFPSLSLWWFLFCACNMAAPPSLNLLSEIMLINSLLSYSIFNMFYILFLSFFSSVYTLYLYTFTQHGKIYQNYPMTFIYVREYLILFLHWVPLNFLLIKSEYFCKWI